MLFLKFLTSPSASTIPELWAVPSKVPIVSNKSTKLSVITTINTVRRAPKTLSPLLVKSPFKSIAKNVLPIVGIENNFIPLKLVTPIGIPIIVVIIIEINIAPVTFLAISITPKTIPIIVNITALSLKSPNATKVPGFATIIPPLFNPIKAIKSPIPAVIANFKFLGIALTIFSLIEVNDNNYNKYLI